MLRLPENSILVIWDERLKNITRGKYFFPAHRKEFVRPHILLVLLVLNLIHFQVPKEKNVKFNFQENDSKKIFPFLLFEQVI